MRNYREFKDALQWEIEHRTRGKQDEALKKAAEFYRDFAQMSLEELRRRAIRYTERHKHTPFSGGSYIEYLTLHAMTAHREYLRAHDLGYTRGYTIAEQMDVADHLAYLAEQEPETSAEDYLSTEAHEIEENSRQYADFCNRIAPDINAHFYDETWDNFDQGISEGIRDALQDTMFSDPVATCTLSNMGGVAIYDTFSGIETYVIYRYYDDAPKVAKTEYDRDAREYFNIDGDPDNLRIYLDECLSVNRQQG